MPHDTRVVHHENIRPDVLAAFPMDCVTVTLSEPILRGEFLQIDNIVLILHNSDCAEKKTKTSSSLSLCVLCSNFYILCNFEVQKA